MGLTLAGCLQAAGGRGDDSLSELSCEAVQGQLVQQVACLPAGDGLLLQVMPGTQVKLETHTAALTFDSTVYWELADTRMIVSALDGVAVLESGESTRIVRNGTQAFLERADDTVETTGPPSDPRVIPSDTLAALPLNQLARPVSASTDSEATSQPTPMPAPTQAPAQVGATSAPSATSDNTVQAVGVDVATPTSLPDSTGADGGSCTPNPDWTGRYTVESGDTLFRISQTYGVGIDAMIEANCLDNPDQLALGQELRVPPDEPTAAVTQAQGTSPQPTQPQATVTPAGSNRADFSGAPETLSAGQCATLSWAVSSARMVSLEGDPVAQEGQAEVCPASTTTYSLLVVYDDGSQVGYAVTITVTS